MSLKILYSPIFNYMNYTKLIYIIFIYIKIYYIDVTLMLVILSNIANILLHIVCYDIWFYFSHLIFHTKQFYFIHKVHHLQHWKKLTYRDANTGHWIENIVLPLGVFIPFIFIECSKLLLVISLIIISLRGLARHDHRYTWIDSTHHMLHHRYNNCNYGEYWLDKLFGTHHKVK